MQGYRDTGIQGYRDTRVQKYRDTWLQDTGIRGYMATGIHGYRATGIEWHLLVKKSEFAHASVDGRLPNTRMPSSSCRSIFRAGDAVRLP